MWIDEYRARYGLELDDMARRVNVAGRKLHPPLECTVTDTLIHILEISKVPRTHPRIANAIALACKATAEQRDSIVAERHRGKWKPPDGDYTLETLKDAPRKPDCAVGERAVVQIDRNGYIIGRYKSVALAVMFCGVTQYAVTERCLRRAPNEFDKYGFTFRYANEWDKLTMTEKLIDLGVDVGE